MTEFTERQKEIVEAAIQLIAEGGIQELTIRNLARRIGVSEPALYRHFESKLAILKGILGSFSGNSRAIFEKAVRSGLSGAEQLRAVLTAHFEQFARYPPLSAVLFSEDIFQNDGQLAGEVLAIMEAGQGYLQQIVRRGMEEGEFRGDLPAEHLVVIIMGALRLTVTRWRLAKYAFDLRREGETLWESLRALLAADRR